MPANACCSAAGPAKGEGWGDAEAVANWPEPERSTPHTRGVATVSTSAQPNASPEPLCRAKPLPVARQVMKRLAPFVPPVLGQASPFAKAWPA